MKGSWLEFLLVLLIFAIPATLGIVLGKLFDKGYMGAIGLFIGFGITLYILQKWIWK